MRVMLDTNVLLSVLLFPSVRMDGMMRCIFEEHRMVLSSFVVEELAFVVQRKFPAKATAVDRLLSAMSWSIHLRRWIKACSIFVTQKTILYSIPPFWRMWTY